MTLDVAVLRGGRGEVKSNVGKGKVLLGSEIRGRSGTSATYRQNIKTQSGINARSDLQF